MQPVLAIKQFLWAYIPLATFHLRFMAKDKTTLSISETVSSETVSDQIYSCKKCHTSCLSKSCDLPNDGFSYTHNTSRVFSRLISVLIGKCEDLNNRTVCVVNKITAAKRKLCSFQSCSDLDDFRDFFNEEHVNASNLPVLYSWYGCR